MLGHLVNDGYQVVDDPGAAEVIVVNTCGFIDAAKEESVDTILDLAQYKSDGKCKVLVVAGCLSQRYAPDLAREIPEVDHFVGVGNFEEIAQILGGSPVNGSGPLRRSRLPLVGEMATDTVGHQRERGHFTPRLVGRRALVPYRHDPQPGQSRAVVIPDPDYTVTASSPRLRTSPVHSAYVKIAEGCSNTCAFCIIPAIRGPQRSRPVADVVTEVERLARDGTVEINLIAQDLCAYGRDLLPRQSLAELLRQLNRIGEQLDHPFWIRCLYAYPKGLTRELMEVMASSLHVLPYLDIPLQHISDPILRRMRRGKGGAATRALIARLRATIPNLTLRTTFITGLPGETEADFRELCEFVEEARFERMGVFTFSPEEDTPAALMPNPVEAEVAVARRNQLMELQQRISRQQQRRFIGRTLEVLVEGVSEQTDLLLQGRHRGQAPDIDGVTYINDGSASPGEVVRVRVDQAGDYDLVGGIVTARPRAQPRRRPVRRSEAMDTAS
jgi:ribosomal protein S12 methylthiotransferase